tara:strand:+ start:60 stop:809 length:750 start_codon:yes stop_codon:yes gene_type:complete
MAKKETTATTPDSEARDDVLGNNNMEVAPRNAAPFALGKVTGDVPTQPRLPRLKVTHGVGGLADAGFAPGEWVLNDEASLAKRGDPLLLIILSADQYYKEYDSYNSGGTPRSFNSAEEVTAAGETVEWSGPSGAKVAPTFSPAMNANLFIRRPEGIVDGAFGVKIGEHEYAPAVYTADKQAFTPFSAPITTASGFSLRERGLHSGVFELRSASKKLRSGNSVTVPTLRLIGHLSDEELAAVASYFETGN